jgi:hypothetical protein
VPCSWQANASITDGTGLGQPCAPCAPQPAVPVDVHPDGTVLLGQRSLFSYVSPKLSEAFGTWMNSVNPCSDVTPNCIPCPAPDECGNVSLDEASGVRWQWPATLCVSPAALCVSPAALCVSPAALCVSHVASFQALPPSAFTYCMPWFVTSCCVTLYSDIMFAHGVRLTPLGRCLAPVSILWPT